MKGSETMLTSYSVNLGINDLGYAYLHLHEHYEICYVLEDGVTLTLENNVYDVHAGDLFVIPPYIFHKFSSDLPYDRACIFFDEYTFLKKAPTLESAFKYLGENGFFVVTIPEEEKVNVAQQFIDAYNALNDTDSFMYDYINTRSLGDLLFYIINMHKLKPTTILKRDTSGSIIGSILQYISHNLTENISTEAITKKYNISKTKLYNMFKESTGMSLKEFTVQLRISRAAELLSQGLSVTEVSNRTGFNSYAHFIKIFKQKTGVSPYRYGKRLQSSNSLLDRIDSNGGLPINRPGARENLDIEKGKNSNNTGETKKN